MIQIISSFLLVLKNIVLSKMPPQTTPLSQLLKEDEQMADQQMHQQMHQQQMVDQQQHPQMQYPETDVMVHPPSVPSKKDFFGNIREIEWKSIVLVFAIILILSSGMFASCIRPYVPGSVGSDGRVSITGSLVAAFIGTLIFVIVKLVGKF